MKYLPQTNVQLLLGSEAHLNVLVSKQILHQCPVHSRHPGMMNGKAVRKEVLQLQVLQQKHNQLQVFHPSQVTPGRKEATEGSAYPRGKTAKLHRTGSIFVAVLLLSLRQNSPGRAVTLHCSASVLRTSVEAEPSRKKRPRVSFSRHMSLMARAVFPVSFLECTNTNTC